LRRKRRKGKKDRGLASEHWIGFASLAMTRKHNSQKKRSSSMAPTGDPANWSAEIFGFELQGRGKKGKKKVRDAIVAPRPTPFDCQKGKRPASTEAWSTIQIQHQIQEEKEKKRKKETGIISISA